MTHVRAATEATGATSAVDGAAAGAGDDDAAAEADWWLAIPFFRRCNHGGRGSDGGDDLLRNGALVLLRDGVMGSCCDLREGVDACSQQDVEMRL